MSTTFSVLNLDETLSFIAAAWDAEKEKIVCFRNTDCKQLIADIKATGLNYTVAPIPVNCWRIDVGYCVNCDIVCFEFYEPSVMLGEVEDSMYESCLTWMSELEDAGYASLEYDEKERVIYDEKNRKVALWETAYHDRGMEENYFEGVSVFAYNVPTLYMTEAEKEAYKSEKRESILYYQMYKNTFVYNEINGQSFTKSFTKWVETAIGNMTFAEFIEENGFEDCTDMLTYEEFLTQSNEPHYNEKVWLFADIVVTLYYQYTLVFLSATIDNYTDLLVADFAFKAMFETACYQLQKKSSRKEVREWLEEVFEYVNDKLEAVDRGETLQPEIASLMVQYNFNQLQKSLEGLIACIDDLPTLRNMKK